MFPILFSLGSINIYSFGVFLALAFVVGAFYVWRQSRNELEEELIFDALVIVVLFAFLGARLLYIFSHFANFNFDLLRWLHLYLYPGFSFWGGVVGGLGGTFWFAQRRKISFWRLADFLVLGASLGQIFGQIGCFLNSCTVGKVTNLPWGIPVLGLLGKRHPVAFYDLLAAIFIFFVLIRVYRWIFIQRQQRESSAILAYLTLLSLLSFPLEFFREGGVYFYNLSINQWLAIVFFLGAVILWSGRLHNLLKDILGGSQFNNWFKRRKN